MIIVYIIMVAFFFPLMRNVPFATRFLLIGGETVLTKKWKVKLKNITDLLLTPMSVEAL